MTGTLLFNSIKLYGYHGIYKEEALVGTFFIVSIKAVLKVDFANELTNLENSVNYEELYQVLKNSFEQREDLIETVALNIYKALKKQFDQVQKWTVSIEKQNPLGVGGFNPVFCLED